MSDPNQLDYNQVDTELDKIFDRLNSAPLETKLEILKSVAPPHLAKMFRDYGKKLDSTERENFKNNDVKEACSKFMSSDKSSDTSTLGYISCCDLAEICGSGSGMATWIIVIIIIVILGCISAGGAAFFFFYWNRKMGGRDVEEVEEEMESEEDASKNEHEISVNTY
ncbi:hypothetical protein L3Y34_019576 [Caenorhabditis briggsae]|uniref:Uncharacterized protein n=1 Tax=Caenorhabditis briggsae TaxID=6238 RepID=A0AAE9DP20_CAEBR|nr:hypothetical protein L3Y34_019576 [Caenorhabditis briggsae]